MNNKSLKIAYSPLKHTGNKFFQLTQDCINFEKNINIVEYKEPIKNFKYFNDIDIVFFNCYEDIKFYEGLKGKIKRLLIFLNRIFSIKFLKFKKVKIVYTVHNKISHDINNIKYSKWLSKFLCKNSDKVIILSDDTKEVLKEYLTQEEIIEKVVKIPHPSYEGVYEEKKEINLYKKNKSSMIILFLGMIRPYKNLELLLKMAQKTIDLDIHYVIAGGGKDSSYVNKIINEVEKNNNVSIIPRFIEDDEMSSIIKQADLLLFPYDKTSLNSGSIILAFSYKKTVISPRIGTINEFPLDLTFNYEYSNEKEHEEELLKQIKKAYNLYKNDNEIFNNMGKNIYVELQKKSSKCILGKKYKNLIKDLIRGK